MCKCRQCGVRGDGAIAAAAAAVAPTVQSKTEAVAGIGNAGRLPVLLSLGQQLAAPSEGRVGDWRTDWTCMQNASCCCDDGW
jgi:hypothetical protein